MATKFLTVPGDQSVEILQPGGRITIATPEEATPGTPGVTVSHGTVNQNPVALPGGAFGDTPYTPTGPNVVVSGVATVKLTFDSLPGAGRGTLAIQAGFDGSFGNPSYQYFSAAVIDPGDFTYITTLPFNSGLVVGTSPVTLQFNTIAASPDGVTGGTVEVIDCEFTVEDPVSFL